MSSSLMGVFISFRPFAHLFEATSPLCLDDGGFDFVFSLTLPLGYHHVFGVHVFRGFVQYFGHCLWVILVEGEEKLPRLQPTGEGSNKNFIVSFVN